MNCPSGFEYLHRPYPYARQPFRLALQEKVAYEGRHFSIPAFGLLLDKRLFTAASSHPVNTSINLYINKDAGLFESIEPTLDASGYERATPHYADYILDMRDLLEEVVALHAADSEYTADDFFRAHMQRNRAVYDLANSSASGTSDLEYVHPDPVGITPARPFTSGIPIELGSRQFQDIDLDEVMWQPFARPKSPTLGTRDIPLEPIFPAVLPNGQLPVFSILDEEKFGELGFNVAPSGGVLITGDGLTEGTSIKLLTGPGQSGATEGSFVQNVPWKRFPANDELNRYYETQNSGCISVSGRQAIYEIPAGLADDTVYLLDVSEVGSSGQSIQHWPGDYHATSGIDANRRAHTGVHVTDRLLYNLNESNPNQLSVGRSLINGKKVFGHFVGSERSSLGHSVASRLAYSAGNDVYFYGGVSEALIPGGNQFNDWPSRFEWASTDNTLSPITWLSILTTALGGRPATSSARASVTYDVADIMYADQVIWRKYYAQWGYSDFIVCPGQQRAGGGNKVTETINYLTRTYREGTDAMGNFAWIELDPPESPQQTTQDVKYFADTYAVNNVFTLFFASKANHGFVHCNGKVYLQWSDQLTTPRRNLLLNISDAPRSTVLVPPTDRTDRTYVVGFFPSWALRRAITTNNQITKPHIMSIVPAASEAITFASDVPMTSSNVLDFGPVVWDPATSLNYLYFVTLSGLRYFAKMNTSMVITHINRVATTDAVIFGRPAILNT